MIDLLFRSFSRARWITVATAKGVYDAQGNVNPGFGVDELGNVTITPAVLDAQGNIVTPAVIDTWWCVNLRVYGPQADADADAEFPGETDTNWKFLRSKLASFIRTGSTLVMVQGMRTYQAGTTTNRIQLFDPRDITIPPRIWAGGMSY